MIVYRLDLHKFAEALFREGFGRWQGLQLLEVANLCHQLGALRAEIRAISLWTWGDL